MLWSLSVLTWAILGGALIAEAYSVSQRRKGRK